MFHLLLQQAVRVLHLGAVCMNYEEATARLII